MIKRIQCWLKGHDEELAKKDIVSRYSCGTSVHLNRPYMKCKRCNRYRKL